MTDSTTKDRTAQTIESNPLAILIGGIAIGAVVGALTPRSAKEKELLAPLGKKLGERARAAGKAARAAGQNELAELGLTKGAAKIQAQSLFDGVAKALSTAGNAAAKTAAKKG
jgi:hypothetical protein